MVATLLSRLQATASQYPRQPALLAPGRPPLIYQELLYKVEQAAYALQSLGLRPADRVALLLPDGLEMAFAFLAVSAHCASAPLNPAYGESELEFYLADLGAKALLTLADSPTPARQVAPRLGLTLVEVTPNLDLTSSSPVFASQPSLAPDPSATALLLHTSGTTSRPKLVPLSQANLCASARNIAHTLQLSPADRCLNIMPLFHIHGLLAGLLASLYSGGSVICSAGFSAASFFSLLEALSPTWYTAVPTMHQAILAAAPQHAALIARARLRLIRSSSASLPPKVMADLEATFSCPVIEAYGMTEAAHQMASNPLPPAVRKPASVGLPAGPQIAIMDEAGNLLAAGEKGEIVIRGENVTAGYEANPAANATAFAHGWFHTGDQGYLDEDGYLFITGRLKEIINRGGEKIAPREVDEVLLEHPAVAQAVTFAVPHPTLGEDVVAAVVLKEGHSAGLKELRGFALQRLAPAKAPSQVLIVDQIPKGPTGKLQRIGLAEKLAHLLKPPYLAPQGEVSQALARLWGELLRLPQVGMLDNFFMLGGDSLLAAQLAARLRQVFDLDLPLVSLFQEPTLAGQAALVESALSPDRQAPLHQQILSAQTRQAFPSRIPSRPQALSAPLSFSQEQIYFLQQLEPASPTYNRPFALELGGALDLACLQRALEAIRARHAVLHSLVQPAEEGFIQAVQPPAPFSLSLVDLADLDPELQTSRLHAMLRQKSQQPFDLASELPVRGWIFRLSPERHLLLLVFHHLVFDGWSARVFLQELAGFYGAYRQQIEPDLPPLPIQYGDFAAWQRAKSSAEQLQASLAYWKAALADLQEEATFPPDHPRPAIRSSRGAKHIFSLPASLAGKVRELAQRQNVTPFMVLLASFAALLYRYTGQSDFVIGSPSAGRTEVETEALVGCFLNTLALRLTPGGSSSFLDLLSQVRQAALGAYTHQALPFEHLVRALNPSRDLSRNPLFQVLFNLENLPLEPLETAGLSLSPYEFDDGISRFDLSLELTPHGSELSACLTYATDLYEPATILRLARHWQTLLASLLADPTQTLLGAVLLEETERRALLEAWRQTQVAVPPVCIQTLFEAQVRRTPLAPALTWQGQNLTYQALNERANRLAHLLRASGVSSESLVGVHLPRSPELLISLLAVLKAGGAYLPLDPSLPPRRLADLLQDAQPAWVLSLGSLSASLGGFGGQVLCLDALSPALLTQPAHDPENLSAPTSPAYLVYTSGSTGKPKGVVALHQGVTNYLAYLRHTLGLNEKDVILNLTSFSFDPHARDLFAPLSCGARLVLLSDDQARDPAAILPVIQAEGVTCLLSIVPSFLRLLCDQAEVMAQPLPTLRSVLSGGERLFGGDLHRLTAAFGSGVRLYNQYGPSEVSMASTCFPVTAADSALEPISLGKPVWNTRLYILDEALNPLPPGGVGEIYIGGAGLARGYLNDPLLTQERFISDPFDEPPQAKMYRTGDLGRWDAQGNFHFLGRRDLQIKIRGFRIEPAEVEAALRLHPAVLDCAVMAQPLRPGEPGLVAYWVPQTGRDSLQSGGLFSGGSADPAELKAFLAERLPGYMLPTAFVELEKLPRLPNGKPDRRSLPPPAVFQRSAPGSPRLPENPVEDRLLRIWEDLLGVSPIGMEDDFFALGGHSMLVLKLFLQIEKEYQVRLPLAAIFLSPTPAALSQRLIQALAGKPTSNFTLLQAEGSFPPFFYMHTQHSYSSTILRLAQAAGKRQPFYAVQVPLPSPETLSSTTLEAIAAQTLSALRQLQPQGPYYLGGYSLSGIFAYEMARQIKTAGEEVALLALIDPSLSLLPGYPGLLPLPRRLLYRMGFLIYAFRLHQGNLRRLPLRQKLEYLGERIARRLPAPLQPPTVSNSPDPYREALAIQRSLSRRYVLRPYPGRIILFKSMNRPDYALEPGWFFDRHTSGWQHLAAGGVEVIPMAGDHHSIITEPHIDLLAQKLAECLHAAQLQTQPEVQY